MMGMAVRWMMGGSMDGIFEVKKHVPLEQPAAIQNAGLGKGTKERCAQARGVAGDYLLA